MASSSSSARSSTHSVSENWTPFESSARRHAGGRKSEKPAWRPTIRKSCDKMSLTDLQLELQRKKIVAASHSVMRALPDGGKRIHNRIAVLEEVIGERLSHVDLESDFERLAIGNPSARRVHHHQQQHRQEERQEQQDSASSSSSSFSSSDVVELQPASFQLADDASDLPASALEVLKSFQKRAVVAATDDNDNNDDEDDKLEAISARMKNAENRGNGGGEIEVLDPSFSVTLATQRHRDQHEQIQLRAAEREREREQRAEQRRQRQAIIDS
jgi:hypothetical protein